MWYDIKLYPALRTGTDLNWMKQKGTALMRSMKRAGALTLAALILAFSMGLYICGHLTRRCRRDPAALPLGACLGLAARLLVFLLLPLLILAALTEAYVTPLAAGLFL